ncbi:hypothetical protein [Pseudohalioglobus lutimaris]|uniref:hypothetical protein n=1 Tax=Pseudohalioglobus lutimaris TaxID=1737061 RepID=UPI0010557543|nr:hypothetical protein [Pseudohalioglobus lutimaris]
MNRLYKSVLVALVMGLSFSAWAGDEEICMDCHEPAEDWEGMSAEEIYTQAADTSIKRHADNSEFSEDELKAMIAKLLADS